VKRKVEHTHDNKKKREAQLSQRNRAMFCVNEHFDKSLKIIQDHWK